MPCPGLISLQANLSLKVSLGFLVTEARVEKWNEAFSSPHSHPSQVNFAVMGFSSPFCLKQRWSRWMVFLSLWSNPMRINVRHEWWISALNWGKTMLAWWQEKHDSMRYLKLLWWELVYIWADQEAERRACQHSEFLPFCLFNILP